ncbi:MAG TPA: lactonase family protein [Firmicutes bacterium]|nr:lactonase family protein [Bacillota bacterium]
MSRVLVSGYGTVREQSLSLYEFCSGKPVKKCWNVEANQPSFLAVDQDVCFSVEETEGSAALVSGRFSEKGYTPMDRIEIEGGLLCHITYSTKHHVLYGACYETGHVIAVQVENGFFRKILHHFILGEEPGKISRAHCCLLGPNEDWLYITNIALDRIYCYRLTEGGEMLPAEIPYTQLPSGIGPRHLAWHPNGNLLLITEYSSEILVFRPDFTNGSLNLLQACSALPDQYKQRSDGSSIAVAQDGWIYAANRGANTIAAFFTDMQGVLHKKWDFPCAGHWPRHIALSKDGQYLFSANQHSGEIAVFGRSADGGLMQVQQIPFAQASFVQDL